jgi:hypothetical protein
MQDISATTSISEATESQPSVSLEKEADSVSTHVLVSEEQVFKLRELSRITRIAQSEYLREAVEDLLRKYGRVLSEAK